MQIFIEKTRVVINETFDDVECSEFDDNSTIRVVKLTVKGKDYYYTPILFIGKKDAFCSIIYGKQTVNLFKARENVEILKDYNTTGLKLECNSKGVPLFFHRKD